MLMLYSLKMEKLARLNFFVWDKDSAATLAAFREVYPDLAKPFFFQDAAHHTKDETREVLSNNKFPPVLVCFGKTEQPF